ncbi:replication initiation protein [Palleronia sp. LCG004]|uniref:replication initiation protein n=1 Tax=Palleronia sp. LCG004 TaxID=3079304 RepID=UPI002941C438|nr:replication initiation protein [Palleronia sp. LCG004]WOI58075.1 replication initiation protein [Palleronia sp. LCG004]
MKLSGEYRGDPWGAVVLAEWHITEGGSMARLLIPPAGVHALRSPANFTKIEATAAHRLTGHARRLYAILADKKRLGRPYWTFTLEELRALMAADTQKSYDRFNTFRQRVLDPAVEAINDYGTVTVTMTPEKRGRSVHAVRFDWRWKDPHDATETAAENERHSQARRQRQAADDAPPMIEEQEQTEPALTWWGNLTDAKREEWAKPVGRTFELEGPNGQKINHTRRQADIARNSFLAFCKKQSFYQK